MLRVSRTWTDGEMSKHSSLTFLSSLPLSIAPLQRSRRRPPWSACQARHRSVPATPRFLDTHCMCHIARRVVLRISRTLSRGGRSPEHRHHRSRPPPPPAAVARPPRALSRPSKATSGCAVISWCSPTTPSPPTWPPFAGTGSAPASPLFPFATKDHGDKFDKMQGVFCRTHDSDE